MRHDAECDTLETPNVPTDHIICPGGNFYDYDYTTTGGYRTHTCTFTLDDDCYRQGQEIFYEFDYSGHSHTLYDTHPPTTDGHTRIT